MGQVPERLLPSIEKPPELDLKPFPSHLRYAYLGESETLQIIISLSLSKEKRENLLRVLCAHKTAIELTLANIRGISPSLCMHRILMEDNYKLTIEAQRCLNPSMIEVVRKKILKWLNAGVIYLISIAHR